ncbi:unnamed protein product, partial [Hapterophycus canaliculatus]
VAIVGGVGSGKSTVMAGILGEVPVFMADSGVGAHMRVCYAAQTPWVMSGTVRENILFGLPLHHERYR